jgi:hypothetical protein
MEPVFRPWQPIRGILSLVVIVALALGTVYLINPVQWVIFNSEFNMLLAIYMVFLILFLNAYVTGWPGRMYTPPYQIGWIGKRLTRWYQRSVRAAIHTGILAGLIALSYFVLRAAVGPNFPWMLFFEIQALFVFLVIALLFANWPLHRARQPIQGLGLLGIALAVSAILYPLLHNYGAFYQGAQNVPPEVLAVLLPPGTTPEYLGAINPNGAVEAFTMATLNTMFLLFIVLFYFLFDMWPFRLLKRQPWVGLSALVTIVLVSIAAWQVILVVGPALIQIDLPLTAGQGQGSAPLAALPLPDPVKVNIVMLYTLGAFQGPLIFAALTWSVTFLWWPTLVRTRSAFGQAPFNRQPWKGLILLAFSLPTAFLAYLFFQAIGFSLLPPVAWQVPGLIPPPLFQLVWMVINFLPGLATYTLFYGVVWESAPQPPLPPPAPDFQTYKPLRRVAPLEPQRRAELREKYVR